MREIWRLGDEAILDALSNADAISDPKVLRALCASAAAIIRELQERLPRGREPKRRGRPQKTEGTSGKGRVGRPRKYSDAVVNAFEELKEHLRAEGRSCSDLATASELFERYGRPYWPFPRNRIEENRLFRRLAKHMSARRNRRPEMTA
jgi:hypothetical protein